MNNIPTTTADVVDDGDYQIINLPEGFQFGGDEVWVQKIGDSVFLSPIINTKNSELKVVNNE
jgi:virulence-associated protein VagC